ncbi:MAG TPA: hypothetical protein VG796_23225 [Verrucomicrobiales bacterium]|jgi:hypothetical protein|nr:hypothetical protein [Verrucomicrobiales bacterium]
MNSRILFSIAVWLCGISASFAQEKTVPAPSPSAAPAVSPPAAQKRTFVRPNVPAALFTPEKTALLEPECERIASFLARYAAEKYTAGVLRGEATAVSQGRLFLTISLHLQPLNASAVHCTTRWIDGKEPSLPAPGDNLRVFSGFLLSAAKRQADKSTPAREALGRILTRLAADLDPGNEDAVYASEIQDRDDKTPPLKELLSGTLGRGW